MNLLWPHCPEALVPGLAQPKWETFQSPLGLAQAPLSLCCSPKPVPPAFNPELALAFGSAEAGSGGAKRETKWPRTASRRAKLTLATRLHPTMPLDSPLIMSIAAQLLQA